MIKYLIAFCFIICTVFHSHAQSIQVNAQLDSTSIVIGDQIKLRLELEKQENIRVQLPVWTDTLTKNIEIIEVFPVDSSKTREGMMRYVQELVVTSFDSGRHVVPPVRFPFTDGEYRDTIASRPLFLDVHTVSLDSAEDIADIKPIYKVPIGWADIWPWLLGILGVLAVVGFIIYIIIRKKKNKPIFGSIKPVDPPHVIALRELDKLRAEKLWQSKRVKDYYTRLSDVVRVYIEGRFGVNAMEMTSDEILNGLQNVGFEDNNLVSRLRQMFLLADLVKFAKAEPMPDENEAVMLDSYLFVNNTKIEDIEPPEEETSEEQDGETGGKDTETGEGGSGNDDNHPENKTEDAKKQSSNNEEEQE